MPFNTIDYLIFFPFVFFIYYLIDVKTRWLVLLISGYIFYGYWSFKDLLILLTITIILYLSARIIDKITNKKLKKLIFLSTLFTVFGILIFFKIKNYIYSDTKFSFNTHLITIDELIIPLGISFYTFQGISYLIDVYKNQIPVEKNIGIFSLYISFFPQLVIGPIETAKNLIPQFRKKIHFDQKMISSGIRLLGCGFFKKIVLSDSLYIFNNQVLNDPKLYHGLPFLLVSFLSNYNLFLDLSAYTDIARGSAKILGINLSENFKRPFFASSSTEFWRRFHRTLVLWFTNYVYMPLCRKFSSIWAIRLNLFITFVGVGLWHVGDLWYIVWGGTHGLLLVLENLLSKPMASIIKKLHLNKTPRLTLILKIIITQVCLCIPVLITQIGRSAKKLPISEFLHLSISDFLNINAMQTYFSIHQPVFHFLMIVLFICILELIHAIQVKQPVEKWFLGKSLFFRSYIYILATISLVLFGNFQGKLFIYFIF